jgi:hypothetical protein
MGNYVSDRIPNKSRPMWRYVGERPSHILGKVRYPDEIFFAVGVFRSDRQHVEAMNAAAVEVLQRFDEHATTEAVR